MPLQLLQKAWVCFNTPTHRWRCWPDSNFSKTLTTLSRKVRNHVRLTHTHSSSFRPARKSMLSLLDLQRVWKTREEKTDGISSQSVSYNGLRDVVLWFGAFGMKFPHFLRRLPFWEEFWEMTSSDFCCFAMPPGIYVNSGSRKRGVEFKGGSRHD